MRAQREDEDAIANGERSLRLESDARRVRLMTLHASKGLEFPIVLLPTLWAHEHRSPKGVALAPQARGGLREALFEPRALNALKEAQAGRALPPALRGDDAGRARLPRVHAADGSPVEAWRQEREGRPGAFRASTRCWHAGPRASALRRASRGVRIGRCRPTRPTSPGDRRCNGRSDPAPPAGFVLPGRYSFSALSGHDERRHVEARAADDERIAPPEPAADDPPDTGATTVLDPAAIAAWEALAPVRGTGFGQAVHDLFETREPGTAFAADPAAVLRALERHAVRTADGSPLVAMVPRVAAMLDRCFGVVLPTGAATPCTLGDLTAARQAHELAFHFHIDRASMAELRRLAAVHGEAALVPDGPIETLRGAMVGAIDLVFAHDGRYHVLDYKTNALPTLADYAPSSLGAAMDAHHYRFQAFLYTLAVHRHLRQRLRDDYCYATHVGPAIYLFVRAAGLAPGFGLWSQRFPEALVLGADRLFAGGTA